MKKLMVFGLMIVFCLPLFGFTTEKKESVALPVLMYHSVLRSRTGKYIISPSTLAQDLDTLLAAGYRTVTVKQLADWVDGIGELPSKPVLITFDDGYYNNLYYARNIFAARNCHAVVSVVGRFTDDTIARKEADHPNYAYLTWEEIGAIAVDGTFEIGNHTYDMHSYMPRFGTGRLPGETDAQYEKSVRDDIMMQQQKIAKVTKYNPICFAYPYGKVTQIARRTVESLGFRVTLTCAEGLNTITSGDPNSLLNLARYNRAPGKMNFADVTLS